MQISPLSACPWTVSARKRVENKQRTQKPTFPPRFLRVEACGGDGPDEEEGCAHAVRTTRSSVHEDWERLRNEAPRHPDN
jgi:hypothetical protein